MAIISFLGPIARKPMQVDVKNLKELRDLLKKDDSLKEWLDICSVAINDEFITDIETKIDKDDKILLFPPVCGG